MFEENLKKRKRQSQHDYSQFLYFIVNYSYFMLNFDLSLLGGGMDFSELLDCPDLEKALLQCRTVRIGSYKVVPEEKVVISEYGIKMKVPSPKGGKSLNPYFFCIIYYFLYFNFF